MRLLYFADPMCSWCYGFGPQLRRLLEAHPEARAEIVMGGLRAYNREPASAALRAMLHEHWEHVREMSGRAIGETVVERDGFVYDTEPACRAVVAARTLDAEKALEYFEAVQLAFYRDGEDVTDGAVLARLAANLGFDAAAFRERFESQALREAARADFVRTQQTGVTGFPTLGVVHGEGLYLVTSGFATDDVLEYRLAEIARRLLPGAAVGT